VNTEKKPCIVISGPTASGKTRLSVALAQELNGSVISADSMQVYRGMDIGSAKIRPEEMMGIPHYLIDVLEPEEEFNVVRFQQMAEEAMEDIYRQGRLPVIAGGTGFYIQALLKNVDFTETEGPSPSRERLERLAAEKGPEALHRMLEERDPASAEAIHPHNVRRVIRALEYFAETGLPISAHNAEQKEKESPYDCLWFVLGDDRQKLYERIDRRVDRMMEEGLLEEVRGLCRRGLTEAHGSMKGLGYKELLRYLKGEISLDEAVRIIKRDTRHFAKRQITWFKREKDVVWLNLPDFCYDERAVLDHMLALWRSRNGEDEKKDEH
jgi:tRNA dimethylallyltransferase